MTCFAMVIQCVALSFTNQESQGAFEAAIARRLALERISRENLDESAKEKLADSLRFICSR